MIQITTDNSSIIITMDAEGKNAMSANDLKSLTQALRLAEMSPLTSGIILTGANRSFCSGLAYNPQLEKEPQLAELFPALEEVLQTMANCRLPLVCVVGGHAIGAGFLMLGAADAVMMTANPKAKFGLPEVMLDLHITRVMADTLRMRFSDGQIRKLLFGGTYVPGWKLEQWGAVDFSSEDESELMEKAKEYIRTLEPHKASVKKCKDVINA